MKEPTYLLASWIFLRLLALIYLAGFLSLAVQIKALVGSEGILPVKEFLQSRRHWGISKFFRIPTLCWFNASDRFLVVQSAAGIILSLLLLVGLAPLPVLVLLWLLYLSLFQVGRIFFGYQWDILLLETGFLAIFIAPHQFWVSFPPTMEPPVVIRWLLGWLLFRLMFSSGMVKLASRDASWRRLTALCHHYETQPLPTRLAWFAHQLPAHFHKVSALVMFAIELPLPFLIFGPPELRHLAGGFFIALMILIQLTGNYGFFNLLGILLSILLFDDSVLVPFAHGFAPSLRIHPQSAPAIMEWLSLPVGLIVFGMSITPMLRLWRLEMRLPKRIEALFGLIEPFRIVNSYGLFSVMTTERPEIILEGSKDGQTWLAYEFKWKPGNVMRPPRFVAPHQPRLDWQMWFAALGYLPNNPWLKQFMERLLEGSPTLSHLLNNNPFPDQPPRFIRALMYDYRFTTRAERKKTGAWWKREQRGFYSPVFNLEGSSNDKSAY
jgi:lipase maturation factor 1